METLQTLRSSSVCVLSAVVLVVLSGSSSALLRCFFCPLRTRGGPCRNISTECAPHELCFTGWRRYGPVTVVAMQGCAPPELCGSNRTLSLLGSELEINYTCCCRDRCNTAQQEKRLKSLIRVTGGPIDDTTTTTTTAAPSLCPKN